MVETKEQFIVDKMGNRTGVLINIDDYDKILEDLEELYAIRAYDAAKASEDKAVDFGQAVKEIEQNRK